MKLKVSIAGPGGASAEVLAELADGSSPDQVRDAVRTHAAALRAGLADEAPPAAEDDGLKPRRSGPPPPRDNDAGKPPENGRQLLAWAGDRGCKRRVLELKDAWELPDQVVSWGRDEALSVYHELLKEADRPAPRGGYGRNRYAGGRA